MAADAPSSTPRLSVAAPCFNEAEGIAAVVAEWDAVLNGCRSQRDRALQRRQHRRHARGARPRCSDRSRACASCTTRATAATGAPCRAPSPRRAATTSPPSTATGSSTSPTPSPAREARARRLRLRDRLAHGQEGQRAARRRRPRHEPSRARDVRHAPARHQLRHQGRARRRAAGPPHRGARLPDADRDLPAPRGARRAGSASAA